MFITMLACKQQSNVEKEIQGENNAPPEWAKSAIWYQIFVERFRNGNPSNNPTKESLNGAWPDDIPSSWKVTPWTQDWYEPDPWFKDLHENNFYTGIQARRYGGDLQGVLEKIPYLAELGINAIYFNPLNDAPSLHKYDPAYYHHIDRHFGNDPDGDTELLNNEDYANPESWIWTAADKLFLQVIQACHERNIRVIMDYSFNHTGRNFWAFKDIEQKGPKSAFNDWYNIDDFGTKSELGYNLTYRSWAGATTLPEFKEKIYSDVPEKGVLGAISGDLYDPTLKAHIYAVCKRWLDPNQDGDPSDGIDGFRLDVAAEVPIKFWQEFRKFVKQINPQAYLVGEIWWEAWPDKLLDPQPFLGTCFDAVMNYRWYREARRFFGQVGKVSKPSTFVENITKINHDQPLEIQASMMNLISGHDSPRAISSFINNNLYKQKANPRDSENYNTNRPKGDDWRRFKLLLAHQFTFIGAPQIWNGDEMGMWGADDPDNRKPLIWPDFEFQNEVAHPFNLAKSNDEVVFNDEIFNFYKDLINLRKNYPLFSLGDLSFILQDDDQNCMAYKRSYHGREAIILFNLSKIKQNISIENPIKNKYINPFNEYQLLQKSNKIRVSLDGLSYAIYIEVKDK